MRFGIWELLIILVICVLLFGSKRLRTLGGDVAAFVKGLRSGLKDGDDSDTGAVAGKEDTGRPVIEGEARAEREKTHV